MKQLRKAKSFYYQFKIKDMIFNENMRMQLNSNVKPTYN